MLQIHNQSLRYIVIVGNIIESPQLPAFSALTVIDVQEGHPVLPISDRGCDAAIHSAAYEHNPKRSWVYFGFDHDSASMGGLVPPEGSRGDFGLRIADCGF